MAGRKGVTMQTRRSLGRWLGVLAVVGMACSAAAQYTPGKGYTIKLGECQKLNIGADTRIRLDHYDRDAWYGPDRDMVPVLEEGPALDYLRVRHRIWMRLDLADNLYVYGRVAQRWQHFSSRPGPTDNQDGYATWEYPDEVYIDNLYIDVSKIGGTGWGLRLGRQDFRLGNGMVVLEGTPYDQGRSIYMDGVVLSHTSECDEIKFLAMYMDYKDRFLPIINDQNRRLRRGRTTLAGVDWIHKFNKYVNTEAYYLFMDIDDDREDAGERESIEVNHPWPGAPSAFADENAEINVAGLRLFGSPHALVDYSLEAAQQWGRFQGCMDMTGRMVDARLTLKTTECTPLQPTLMLEYLYMSGDDQSSGDEFEGWHPFLAEYPIWREELTVVGGVFNGNWTNLNRARAAVEFKLLKNVKLTTAYDYLFADYGESGLGNGDSYGHLVSVFLDYTPFPWLAFSVEAAELFPGNYWQDGHNSEWVRLQTTLTF